VVPKENPSGLPMAVPRVPTLRDYNRAIAKKDRWAEGVAVGLAPHIDHLGEIVWSENQNPINIHKPSPV
jgi:hypothetical protein